MVVVGLWQLDFYFNEKTDNCRLTSMVGNLFFSMWNQSTRNDISYVDFILLIIELKFSYENPSLLFTYLYASLNMDRFLLHILFVIVKIGSTENQIQQSTFGLVSL